MPIASYVCIEVGSVGYYTVGYFTEDDKGRLKVFRVDLSVGLQLT